MTEVSKAPLPANIPPAEYDWQVVSYKRRGRKPASPTPPSPPPARPDLRDRMWHTHKYAKAPEVEIRNSLRSSRDFNQTPTAANFRDERVGRNESQHRAAQEREHGRRRQMPPPQDTAVRRQGVSKTKKQGHKPTQSSLQDRDMMSIDDRGTRGGSKGVRSKRVSKRTDRTPLRGDA